MKRFSVILTVLALAGTSVARPQAVPTPSAKADSAAATRRLSDPSPLLQALLKDITLTAQQQRAVDSIRQTYLSRLPPNALTAPDSATIEKTRNLLALALEAVREKLDAHQKNIWDHNVAAEMSARMRVGP